MRRFAIDETAESLTFDIVSSDHTAHVRLSGAIVPETAFEFTNVIGGLLRSGHRGLHLDFGQLRTVAGVAVGTLNHAAAELRGRGGELLLHNVPTDIAALLQRCGLHRDVLVNPASDELV